MSAPAGPINEVIQQDATPAPAATPVPVEALESIKDYRARRGEVADLREGDTPEPAAAAEPAAEVKPAAEPDPASDAGKELAKKRGSLQARIDEITREKGESERALQARIAALQAQIEAVKPPAQPAQPAQPEAGKETAAAAWKRLQALPDAPKVTEFDNYEDFLFAASSFVAEKKAEEIQQRRVVQDQASAFTAARDRVEATAKKEFSDFEQVMESFVSGGGKYAPAAAEVIFNHPDGHKLAYALAKDPALNARLAAITHPVQFGLEVAQVLAKLAAPAAGGAAAVAPAPVVPKVSAAPAPVPSEIGGQAPNPSPDPDKITSVAEWRKQRERFTNAA